MEENHPARHSIHSDNNGDLSPTRAAIELGVTRGYSMYADRLLDLTKAIKKAGDIGEPTYEKEETAETEK